MKGKYNKMPSMLASILIHRGELVHHNSHSNSNNSTSLLHARHQAKCHMASNSRFTHNTHVGSISFFLQRRRWRPRGLGDLPKSW